MIRRVWDLVRGVASDFSEDDVLSLAAAVAFYTALSFAPLVLLLVTLGSFLGEAAKSQLLGMFSQQLGPKAAEVTRGVVEAAEKSGDPATDWWRVAASTVGLLITASAVFGQLQVALNRVWGVQARPSVSPPDLAGFGQYVVPVWVWLRRRLISMGMVLVVLFILLVSLVASAAMGAVVPEGGQEAWARAGEFVVSFLVAVLLFGAIFKLLPDRPVPWRNVWLGAVVTSTLFNAGKLVLALYIDKVGVGRDYGEGIGGLIALLVWVFYSCVVLLVGAEITQRITRREPGDEVRVEQAARV